GLLSRRPLFRPGARRRRPALAPGALDRPRRQRWHVPDGGRHRGGSGVGLAASRRARLLGRRRELRHLPRRGRNCLGVARAGRAGEGTQPRRARGVCGRRHGLARGRRDAALGRDDGRGRRARAGGQRGRRADASPLAGWRREHALGLDLQPQRRHRQRRCGARGARRVRHRHRLAGHHRGLDHGGARHLRGLADHPAGHGGVASATGTAGRSGV
ncbi:MAG: Cobalt-zinc-cadmium resistance protein CzcD, partial [uncultured Acetobacteraceae bacterium]